MARSAARAIPTASRSRLEGIDAEHPGEVRSQAGRATPVPRVVGKIRRRGPVELRDVEFLLRQTERATKITLPGPFTLSQQAKNEFYKDEEEMAMDYAAAVNAELRDLKATGVDVVQLDEPWVRTAPDKAERYGVRAINRALEGIEGPTVMHLCFGYAHVVHNKPGGYAFLPQLADTLAQQISIEAASRKSISAYWRTCRASRSCWACSISAAAKSRPRSRSPRASARACGMLPRSG